MAPRARTVIFLGAGRREGHALGCDEFALRLSSNRWSSSLTTWKDGPGMITAEPTTHTLDVPGARLHYEIRGSGPLLLLVGAPMSSAWFAPLAEHLADAHTVVTTDPRGIGRSPIDDPEQDSTPELRAEDVHHLLTALDAGPATVFGSSGGAITGLALVARHPEQVGLLVAHEPPVLELLPDHVQLRAGIDDICDTYRTEGPGPAWAKFMVLGGFGDDGPTCEPPQEPPAITDPDPEANDAYMMEHMLRPTTRYRPDIAALQAATTRIVVAGGAASAGQLAHRAAAALGGRLGTPLVEFPGDHGGFVGNPEAFARTLRRVIASG